jgi:hypothetical protein
MRKYKRFMVSFLYFTPILDTACYCLEASYRGISLACFEIGRHPSLRRTTDARVFAGNTWRSEMMYLYSNGAVLEALRRAQFRQVPWPNRPRVFEFLRQQGLLETMRQPSRPGPGHHEPVDIAVLTARGKEEIDRLEQREQSSHWIDEKALVYVLAARAEAALGPN